MNKTILLKINFLILACFALLSFGSAVFAQAPTANAGTDLYLNSGQTAVLQGSGYDPNGYSLTHYWSCNGGTLSSYSIAQPTYTASYVYQYNNQATYTCTLTVSNNYGYSNSDSTTIYVNYSNNPNIGGINVQTNSATNIYNNQATLNGYATNPVYGTTTNVWFQWGTTTSYGNETTRQTLNYGGSFSQNIANLSANTTYHFRAVAQASYGNIVYGQDMTFYTSGSGGYYGSGYLSVSKKVINLTSGNLNWQTSVTARPSDVLSFAITLQPQGQDAHNVFVRDVLPANLLYRGYVTVNNSSNYSGDITSGINIGTVYANQPVVVAYQVQVASATSLVYGTTTRANNATITSTESGAQTATAQVFINNTAVSGVTYVPTGITNDLVKDSFFLPAALIILGSWLYFSGNIYKFSDWLGTKL